MLKILVVDDDAALRKSVCAALSDIKDVEIDEATGTYDLNGLPQAAWAVILKGADGDFRQALVRCVGGRREVQR